MKEIDAIDKKLLNILQDDFPVVEKPFENIGCRLNITEENVINRIKSLIDEKDIIRQISPIFDTKKLDYKSSLIAFKVNEKDIDRVANIVNEHPGVSHNYKRDCDYNLWFTIAIPPGSDFDTNCNKLVELSGVSGFLVLPVLKEYKIGVKFDLENDNGDKENSQTLNKNDKKLIKYEELSENDINFIRVVQNHLDIVPQPFKIISGKINISQTELIDFLNKFIENKKIRRFAAVLNHRQAGFLSNTMVAWNIDEEKIDECGRIISEFKAVSHCYRRQSYPDWQYSLYSMIHSADKRKCEEVIDDISRAIEFNHYKAVYSVKEYKKVRVKYFTEEQKEWENKYLTKDD